MAVDREHAAGVGYAVCDGEPSGYLRNGNRHCQDRHLGHGRRHKVSLGIPGTPYDPAHAASTPKSSYTYTEPSGGQPGSTYTITVTVTWQVTWTATDGESGMLPPQTPAPATTTVKIGELQAVNR